MMFVLLTAALLFQAPASQSAAQHPSPPVSSPPPPSPQSYPAPNPDNGPLLIPATHDFKDPMDQARINYANSKAGMRERTKAMTRDTDRLLNLVRDLQQEVARPSSSSSSDDLLQKIKRIEKLARTVKERARGDQ